VLVFIVDDAGKSEILYSCINVNLFVKK